MNTKKLKEVLSIQSTSYDQFRMFAYLIRQAKVLNVDYFVNDGNIYLTKGEAEIYPCIIAHMDTVHEITDDLTVVQVGDNLTGINAYTMQQTGIGGDDKAGVFIALECLKKFDNIKVAFFRDEETGCEGSYNALIDFFDNCSFVLQCDRRGNDDFIINASGTDLSSTTFQRHIADILPVYNYKFNYGAMTDVMTLKQKGLKISTANISCGYYNPHSHDEYVNISDVRNCLELVETIVTVLPAKKYTHQVKRKEYKKTEVKKIDQCESCLQNVDINYSTNWRAWICNDCKNLAETF